MSCLRAFCIYLSITAALIHIAYAINKESPTSFDVEDSVEFVAATYSPTWWGSTIGDGELNFSVRNGKRWILTAITATIYVLRKNNLISNKLESFAVALCTFLAYFLSSLI